MGKFGPLLLIHPKYLGALRNHGNSAAGPDVVLCMVFWLKGSDRSVIKHACVLGWEESEAPGGNT